eukprot:UN23838
MGWQFYNDPDHETEKYDMRSSTQTVINALKTQKNSLTYHGGVGARHLDISLKYFGSQVYKNVNDTDVIKMIVLITTGLSNTEDYTTEIQSLRESGHYVIVWSVLGDTNSNVSSKLKQDISTCGDENMSIDDSSCMYYKEFDTFSSMNLCTSYMEELLTLTEESHEANR